MTSEEFPPELLGRRRECEALDTLLANTRAGRSQVLVLHGEAGIGKTALLDYLLGRAGGCRIARSSGVESEMELPYAGLHQLCAPFLQHVERLPIPQKTALQTAFGMREGTVPDRFMVGLAVLSLLAEVAEERPLICVIDDAQWLDRASAQTFTFVVRRLLAESIGVVFALREFGTNQDLAGLARLAVEGLIDAEARALLDTVITGPLEEQVRARIVAETHGNPLALLELPRGMTATELAFGMEASTMPLANRIEQGFLQRVRPLPLQTQRLLLAAAAEPAGDLTVLQKAADRLGIDRRAASPAIVAGLIELGPQVRFRHPLVRSAIYRASTEQERGRVHAALADATDAATDPDRRAWHRAHATIGLDDAVAGELESSADRARTRGGVAAAAAFLEHSARLTGDPAVRAKRALAAAQAHHQAGTEETALALLAIAIAGPLERLELARVDLLRAQLVFTSNFGADAPTLLLKAARQLESLDLRLARDTYLEAMVASRFAASDDGSFIQKVATAARAAPPAPEPLSATDLLIDGSALRFTDGYPAAVPLLQRAVMAFGSEDLTPTEGLQWLWYAGMTALDLWDDQAWWSLAERHVRLVRDTGAVPLLPIALSTRSAVHVCAGELREAAALTEEALLVTELMGGQLGPYAALNFVATQGRESEALVLIENALAEVRSRGQGMGTMIVGYAGAVLYNGLARYGEAMAAADLAIVLPDDLGGNQWALAELVEAAHHANQPERGTEALGRLIRTTDAAGTDWALGLQACMRALGNEDQAAESLYREAVDRLGRTRVRLALARAHLLYGEWLRRQTRRRDAREQLRLAYDLLSAMGVEGFAERARRELVATGETVRKRTVETRRDLTGQEAQIARLAANGRTNPEIAAELFISSRTVEWHLRKIYSKLNIGSRRELRDALPGAGEVIASA